MDEPKKAAAKTAQPKVASAPAVVPNPRRKAARMFCDREIFVKVKHDDAKRAPAVAAGHEPVDELDSLNQDA